MTTLLVNDDWSINRINPYTATATFGIPSDGGYKAGAMIGEPTPFVIPDSTLSSDKEVPDEGRPDDHFFPLHINRSGPMYLKEVSSANAAPAFMWPARKFQYDDGTTTFGREVIYADGRNYITPDDYTSANNRGAFMILIVLLLLMVVLYLRSKK